MAVVEGCAGSASRVALVAVEMGYGHLRAASALAEALHTEILEVDRPPLAWPDEQRRWRRVRQGYEMLSRSSQLPVLGRPLRRVLDALTFIPQLHPVRDQSAPTLGVRALERMARRGLGKRMLELLHETGATLVTTFYAPAVIADHHGYPRIVCVVTDADVNRVWVVRRSPGTAIHYCVPTERAANRLRACGVPADHIHLTGFPLPESLIGGPQLAALRRNLGARLLRLDPQGAFRTQTRQELAHFLGRLPESEEGKPPLLTFAVGGAGAQLGIAHAFLPALRSPVADGKLRLALVAGTRPEVARRLRSWVGDAGLGDHLGGAVEIVHEPSFALYYRRFNALLAATDILWTKPSELAFYGALGIPLVFSPPVGVHERANRRWALHRGAGFKQESPHLAWEWLREWLEEGTLAAAAWSGYTRLPQFGATRIAEVVDRIAGQT
jgi:hypothetical protein